MKLWEEKKLTAHSLYSALQANLPCGWQQHPRGQPSVREPPDLRWPLVLGRCHRCLQDAWLPWGLFSRFCLLFYLTSTSDCFIPSTKKCLVCLALLRPYGYLPIPGHKGDSTVNFWGDAQRQLHNGQGDFHVIHQNILHDFKIQQSIHSCQATLDFFLQVRCYGNETDLSDCYHMSRCIKV